MYNSQFKYLITYNQVIIINLFVILKKKSVLLSVILKLTIFKIIFFYNDNKQIKLKDSNKDICIVWISFNIYMTCNSIFYKTLNNYISNIV